MLFRSVQPKNGEKFLFRIYKSEMKVVKKFFAIWAVYYRKTDFGDAYGPKSFSLLYICDDGPSAYQYLYNDNNINPKWLALIQPGHGFGLNYTNYFEKDGMLYKLAAINISGMPEYLLYGGYGKYYRYKEACWPNYNRQIAHIDKYYSNMDGEVTIWKRQILFKGKDGQLLK